jgi:hypothetical protein
MQNIVLFDWHPHSFKQPATGSPSQSASRVAFALNVTINRRKRRFGRWAAIEHIQLDTYVSAVKGVSAPDRARLVADPPFAQNWRVLLTLARGQACDSAIQLAS